MNGKSSQLKKVLRFSRDFFILSIDVVVVAVAVVLVLVNSNSKLALTEKTFFVLKIALIAI